MTRRKRLSLLSFIVIVLLIGAGLVVLQKAGFIRLSQLGLIVPGWEVYNSMGGLQVDHPTMQKLVIDSSGFTSPAQFGTVYILGDVDEPYYGFPTIEVMQGGLSHVNLLGNPTPVDEPALTKSVPVWNATEQKWHTIILDYHVYSYTVTVRTLADKVVDAGGSPGIPAAIHHETLWPREWETPINSGGEHYGKEFWGVIWTKLSMSPWRWNTDTREPPNASYNLVAGWAGIMDTFVDNTIMDQVDNQWGEQPPDNNAKMVIKATIPDGHELQMADDDGTFANPVPPTEWGLIGPDTRIKSSVAQAYPLQLGAGADVYHDWLGASQDVYPCDVAIQYTVITHVLQSHDFVLQTGEPPKVTWPRDYFGWSQDFWVGVLQGLDPFGFLGDYSPLAWFIVTLIAVAFIILIVLAVFAPWVLPRIFGGLRQTRDFAYESIEKRPRRKHSAG